jgi:hypothetical protein
MEGVAFTRTSSLTEGKKAEAEAHWEMVAGGNYSPARREIKIIQKNYEYSRAWAIKTGLKLFFFESALLVVQVLKYVWNS